MLISQQSSTTPVQPAESTNTKTVNQCMIAAKNAVLDKFGVKIEEFTVEQILRFGTTDISAPYLDCIRSIARQYVADLFATLRKYEYNPDLLHRYVVGCDG